jgi:hypothetical protein
MVAVPAKQTDIEKALDFNTLKYNMKVMPMDESIYRENERRHKLQVNRGNTPTLYTQRLISIAASYRPNGKQRRTQQRTSPTTNGKHEMAKTN